MKNAIYASFTNIEDAEKATGALMDFGLKAEDISLIAPEHHADRAKHYMSSRPMMNESDTNRNGSEYALIEGDPSRNEGETYRSGSSGAPLEGDTYRNEGDTYRNTSPNAPIEGDTYRKEGDTYRAPEDPQKDEMKAKTGITTTTTADAVAGAEVGAGVGLGVGVAAALAALLVPGFGLVIGGGALAVAIAGAAATTGAGAIAGGAFGFMKDQGVPSNVVESYNNAFQSGSTILAISATANLDHAAINQILTKYNGTNIRESEYAGTR